MSQRILVVDDNPSIRQSLTEALVDEGFLVKTAADGQDALDVLRTHLPDVMLADIRMPRLDGLGL